MHRQPFLLPALLLLTALRLAVLPLHELSPLESYAVVCGDHNGLWHAMLGPVLPTMVHITTTIFGANEFGVRVLAPLIILGASWMLWLAARGLFDAQTAAWGVVFFNVLPAVNLAAVTFTPMTLSIALSVALLLGLRRALHREHKWHLPWWIVSGVLCLSFFTDWRMILFAVSASAALAVTSRGRRALMKWPVLPIAGGALGVVVTVFLAWGSEHRWIAFYTFPDTPPVSFTSTVWRFLLAHPLPVLAALIWALMQNVKRKPMTYPVAFLLAFGLPMMTLDVLAFGAQPWPQCGYCGWIAPSVLLLAHQLRLWQPMNLSIKPLARFLVLALTTAQSCLILQTDCVRRSGIVWKLNAQTVEETGWLPADPSRDLMGWRDLAAALHVIMQEQQGNLHVAPLIVADRWQLAAPLSVYLNDLPLAQPSADYMSVFLSPNSGKLTPFSYRPGLSAELMASAPVLFITDQVDKKAPPKSLTTHYHSIKLVGLFKLKHHDLTLRTVKVFACQP